VIFEKMDAATVFSLLRTYIQSLPDPLLTREFFSEIVSPTRTSPDRFMCFLKCLIVVFFISAELSEAIDRLPQENKSLLRTVIELVRDLGEREDRKRGRSTAMDRIVHEALVSLLVRNVSSSSGGDGSDTSRREKDFSSPKYYGLFNSIVAFILQDSDVFCSSLSDPEVPKMHPGEIIKFRTYRVKVSDFGSVCNLWLTNYRLIIQPIKEQMKRYPRIPVTTMLSIEMQPSPNKKRRSTHLKLICKDFQTRMLEFESGFVCALFEEALRSVTYPESFTDLYAFRYRKKASKEDSQTGWDVFNLAREADRQGVVPAGNDKTKSNEKSEWRITRVNTSWHEIPTYPADLIVPGLISDSELKKIASAHVRSRFPVVAWFNKRNGAVIVRGDEPEIGVIGDSQKDIQKSFPDIKLMDKFVNGHDPLILLDFGLPRTYALGYPMTQLEWLKFKSNKEMHDAYVAMMTNTADSYQAYNTWRAMVKLTLETAGRVARDIQNGRSVMLVHTSTNDWDYVVSSIAHLLLDGYYRTLTGFQVLLEKEWICFGYGCPYKLAHGRHTDDEQSPAFQMFFECVWIMMQQYPIHFQFTEDLLVFILDCLYSCKYGTFLPSCERERDAFRPYTVSAWSAVSAKADSFTNPFFEEETLSSDMKLRTSVADIKSWSGYYTRHKHSAKTRRAQDAIETVGPKQTVLDLHGIGLSLLPSSISHLTQLHSLNLSRNQFTLMPFYILTLTQLRHLSFEFNPLGLIPADHLYLLGHYLMYLQELNISSTGIDNLPKQVTELKSLRILRCHDNNLRDLPQQFTGLSNLEILDLRNNRLDELPKGFSNLPQLRLLALGHNSLEKLPSDFAKVPSLLVLDLSENRLDKLPKAILSLTSLEVLHLHHNQIGELPEALSELQRLRDLNVGSNNLAEVPREIFKLTNLRRLGLSENSLKTLSSKLSQLSLLEVIHANRNQLAAFPTVLLSLPLLTHIHLEGNQIADPIPENILTLTQLCELNLNNNKIPTLDNLPRLGRMSQLRSLSIKGNLITTLPVTLGLLQDEMEQLELDVDKMVDPRPDICSRGTAAIMRVLWDRLTSSDASNRLRVVFVGSNGPGKSVLINSIGKPIKGRARDGESASATIATTTAILPKIQFTKSRKVADVTVTSWDFTSEEIAPTLQNFYWSERTVFVVVSDLSEDKKLDGFVPWAFALRAAAPRAPIIVVGSHEENSINGKEIVSSVESANAKKYPSIKGWVSACVGGTGSSNTADFVATLKKVVADLSWVGEEVPYSFLQLERLVVYESSHRQPPLATWEEFTEMAASCEISSTDVPRAARYLTQIGTIIHYDMAKLRDTVILDPRYLAQFVTNVLRFGREKAKDGILRHTDFSSICKAPLFPESVHPFLLTLLERFEVAFKLRYTATDLASAAAGSPPVSGLELRSFIPALLPIDQPSELDRLWPTFLFTGLQFGRRWSAPISGNEFIARVMARLMHFCPKQLYWRTGILIEGEGTGELILVEYNALEKAVDVLVRPRTEKMSNMFRHVMETVETVRRLMKLQSVVQVPCTHCLADGRQGTYYFSLGDCERAAMRGRSLYCRDIRPVRIELLVPDLAMSFYAGKTLDFGELTQAKKIGEGAAAEVFKGTWVGAPQASYAIKKLRITDSEDQSMPDQLISAIDDSEVSKAFSEFRREVWLMASLKHPAIVSMLGVVMHPLSIVTEFVGGGNLFDFIHVDKVAFDWPVRLKIALDICAGLTFMHSFKPPITHRDLKSPNILLNTHVAKDWEKEPIIAKVTDFGLTGFAPTLAGREVDNPVWLAPEVMRNEEYTEKADVYSFAVIMYELLTRTQFMGHHSFLSDIENKVILGERPTIPETPECQQIPEWNALMARCWDHESDKRPSFAATFEALKAIRDKYFTSVVIPPTVTSTVMESQSFPSPSLQQGSLIQRTNAQHLGALKDPPEQGPIGCLLSTEDLDGVWVGQRNGKVVLWQYKTSDGLPVSAATAHRPSVSAGTGKMVSSGSSSGLNSPTASAKPSPMVQQGSGSSLVNSGIVGTLASHSDAVVAMCHYQGRVWTAGADKFVREWRPVPKGAASSGFASEVLALPTGLADSDRVTCMLAFDRYLLLGTKSGYLKILDTDKNKFKKDRRLKEGDKDRGGVKCIVAVPKVAQIWVGMTNKIVRLDPKLKTIDSFPTPEGKSMALLVVNKTVWCAGSDGTIRVRSFAEPARDPKTLPGHFNKVYALLSVGRHVWSCGKDNGVLIWEAATQTILGELKCPGDAARHLVLVRRKEVWSGSADGSIHRWSLDEKANVSESLDTSSSSMSVDAPALEESDSDSVSDSASVSEAASTSSPAIIMDQNTPGASAIDPASGRLLKRKRSRRPQADGSEAASDSVQIQFPADSGNKKRAQTLRPSRTTDDSGSSPKRTDKKEKSSDSSGDK
jgi:Leucine-rich repeat (LRR) protein/serine/threonine protein kinase